MKDNLIDDAANLRDTFLLAERDYVRELLQIVEIKELIYMCSQQPSEVLFRNAQSIVNSIETNQIPDELMERAEQKLIALLAAIQDKVVEKKLILLPNMKETQLRQRK